MEGVRIRVLTYNVHGRRDDARLMSALIRELAPDVAILQEGPRRLRWRQQCASMARDVDMLYCAGGQPSMGNVLLTTLRVTVHQTATMRYPLTAGQHMRGAVAAECSIGKASFLVAGSHLSTRSDERPGQAEALREWVTSRKRLAGAGRPLPVLLGADVNETETGPAWNLLADGLLDAATAPRAAVATGVAGTGAVSDAPTAAAEPTFPAAGPVERLDALFVDPLVRVLGYQVVRTPAAAAASDHLPVVVDLLLPA